MLKCAKSYLRTISALIEAGVGKNPKNNDGKTPLYLAAQNSHFKVTVFLTECQEEKEFQDKLMEFVLHEAQ